MYPFFLNRPPSGGRQRPQSGEGGGGGGGGGGAGGGAFAPRPYGTRGETGASRAMNFGSILDPPAFGAATGGGGKRQSVRPNSAGAKNVWNNYERPGANKGPPMGQTMSKLSSMAGVRLDSWFITSGMLPANACSGVRKRLTIEYSRVASTFAMSHPRRNA